MAQYLKNKFLKATKSSRNDHSENFLSPSAEKPDHLSQLLEQYTEKSLRMEPQHYEEGWGPMHVAANAGHHDAIMKLQKYYQEVVASGLDFSNSGIETLDVNYSAPHTGLTSLHLAVKSGHVEAAKILIAANADVNAKTAYGNTPLILAARWGSPVVFRLLLESGADIRSCNSDDETPMDVAYRRWYALHPIVAEYFPVGGWAPNARAHSLLPRSVRNHARLLVRIAFRVPLPDETQRGALMQVFFSVLAMTDWSRPRVNYINCRQQLLVPGSLMSPQSSNRSHPSSAGSFPPPLLSPRSYQGSSGSCGPLSPVSSPAPAALSNSSSCPSLCDGSTTKLTATADCGSTAVSLTSPLCPTFSPGPAPLPTAARATSPLVVTAGSPIHLPPQQPQQQPPQPQPQQHQRPHPVQDPSPIDPVEAELALGLDCGKCENEQRNCRDCKVDLEEKRACPTCYEIVSEEEKNCEACAEDKKICQICVAEERQCVSCKDDAHDKSSDHSLSTEDSGDDSSNNTGDGADVTARGSSWPRLGVGRHEHHQHHGHRHLHRRRHRTQHVKSKNSSTSQPPPRRRHSPVTAVPMHPAQIASLVDKRTLSGSQLSKATKEPAGLGGLAGVLSPGKRVAGVKPSLFQAASLATAAAGGSPVQPSRSVSPVPDAASLQQRRMRPRPDLSVNLRPPVGAHTSKQRANNDNCCSASPLMPGPLTTSAIARTGSRTNSCGDSKSPPPSPHRPPSALLMSPTTVTVMSEYLASPRAGGSSVGNTKGSLSTLAAALSGGADFLTGRNRNRRTSSLSGFSPSGSSTDGSSHSSCTDPHCSTPTTATTAQCVSPPSSKGSDDKGCTAAAGGECSWVDPRVVGGLKK